MCDVQCLEVAGGIGELEFLNHRIDLVATVDNLEYYNPCAM